MKNLIPFTALALLLWLVLGTWWYVSTCCDGLNAVANTNDHTVIADKPSNTETAPIAANKPAPPATAENKVAIPALSITDGNLFKATAKGNLAYSNAGFDFDKPLAADVQQAYQQTAEYLTTNPKRVLEITGLYTKEEPNTSLLPNMGLARAANLKKHLESLGINPKQIATNARIVPSHPLDKDKLWGGIDYSFAEAAVANETAKADADRLTQIEKDLKAKPLVLYFETAKSNAQIDENTRKRFADLIYYLEQKPNKKVTVTGHTDNVGPEPTNLRYGKERAEFAKDYMLKNGLKAAQINTASKGELKPIATNKTAEGRAKNRRAEVSIQ